MIEQFNRINRALGANRVKLEEACGGYIIFEVVNWAAFRLRQDGSIKERYETVRYGGFQETARSRWLHAISLGKKRDDAGNIA